MHQRLKEYIESFNDPFAMEIHWHPISNCNYSYKTRQLKHNNRGDLVFYPTVEAMLLPFVFLAMGFFIMYKSALYQIPLFYFLSSPIQAIQQLFIMFSNAGFSGMLYGFIFGLVFFIVGSIILYSAVNPIIFKSEERIYSKGYFSSAKNTVSLQDIYAVQVLSMKGKTVESRVNYELNLVLKSKRRINVITHAKKESVVIDAAELAKCLAVPLWNLDI